MPAASASAGACWPMTVELAISECVVSAPMRMVDESDAMPRSELIRPMSMSAEGAASLSFRTGIRLCPPASTLESECWLRRVAASTTEPAR